VSSFTNKISVIVDVTTDKAVKGLAGFKTAVRDAEGFTGKLRAGVKSLGTTFGTAAKNPAVMATAVAAVGAAAFAAINQFANLALQVGKFSDATGLSNEESSRWIEVAGDVGVEAGVVEAAIGKMSKTLAATPDKFAALGVEIVRTADGAIDMNATFLGAIDVLNSMTDPIARAKLASDLFGRGWQSMAELVGKSSDELKASLAAVSDQQVIDDAEVAKARKFRAAMDEFGDTMRAFTLEVGEKLIPVLTDAVGVITDLAEAIEWVGDKAGILDFMPPVLDEIGGGLDAMTAAMKAAKDEAAKHESVVEQVIGSVEDAIEAQDAYTESLADAAQQTEDLIQANKDLYESQLDLIGAAHDLERAEDAVYDSIDEYNTVLTESGAASEAADDAAKETATSMYELAAAQSEAKNGTLDSQAAVDDMIISLEVMQSTLEPGSPLFNAIGTYIEELKRIPANIATTVSVIGRGYVGRRGVDQGGMPEGAAGGIVTRPTVALIGEAGPEAVVPLNRTPGSSPLGGFGGGSPITVNVYPRTMPSDTELIDLVNKIRRRGGQI